MGRAPGKLVLARLCLVASGFAWMLAQAELVCAQTQPINPTEIETQEQANQRLLDLAKKTRTPPTDYVVGRGDLMAVEVFDVPELSREVRVSQSGTIGLPLLAVRLHVIGLTEMQIQQKIAEVLEANGLVSHAQVMVSVKEKRSKPIAIVGAVAHPMVYQADRPVTLIEILAEAGGIANDAGDTVIVTRADTTPNAVANEPPEITPEDTTAGNPSAGSTPSGEGGATKKQQGQQVSAGVPQTEKPDANSINATTAVPPSITEADAGPLATTITINLSELLERGDTQNNISMRGGDVVTVPHSGIVYALGAVGRPGGFLANNDRAQLSTLKLLALAGGLTPVAKQDRAVIIRKDATGKQQEIPVDLGRVVKRETEDVRMLPSDILYVPPSNAKAFLGRAAAIALGAGTAVAIYRIGR